MDAAWEPPFCLGQKTGCSQATATGFKNSVVAARYPGSLAGRESKREAVHRASANGDKMKIHAPLELYLVGLQQIEAKRGQQGEEERITRIYVYSIHYRWVSTL